MIDLGGKRRADAAAVGRVRLWAEAGLSADAAAIVMVTELACHEPGCPPVETVIALLCGTSPRTWKIPRAAADLTAEDVAAALARELVLRRVDRCVRWVHHRLVRRVV